VRRLILIPLLALACTSAVAQRGFGGAHFGARFGGRFASQPSGHYRGWGAYPVGPVYWDSLFSADSAEYLALAPPVVVIQQPAAQPQTAAPEPEAAQPAQPLLIELRGGRYVQISGNEDSPSNTDQQSASHPSAFVAAQPPSAPPPSTILVFRDGSRKQISEYTIADGVLYAQANYYTEGSWNKPIALSSLDLRATVDENRARGVRFQIPAAPNQVIVGP
jgi:hypothetical protein